jgi:hypothetical protein
MTLMRSFLINKNLCFYYWLKKRIGKVPAFVVREQKPNNNLGYVRGSLDDNV